MKSHRKWEDASVKRGPIKVKFQDCKIEINSAYIIGQWATHRSTDNSDGAVEQTDSYWTVTHVPSGYAVIKGLRRRTDCICLINRIIANEIQWNGRGHPPKKFKAALEEVLKNIRHG